MAAVERKVVGSDMLLFLDDAGGAATDLVICLTSQSMSRVTNEIDAKSKCGPDKRPGTQEVGIDFEGQIMLTPGANRLGISDLHDLWANKTTVGWKYGKAVPDEGDVTYSGTGFISKLDETAGQDDVATFSASLGVYGAVTKTVEPA